MLIFCFFVFSFSRKFAQNLSAKWSLDDQPGQTGAEDCLKNCFTASHCCFLRTVCVILTKKKGYIAAGHEKCFGSVSQRS